MTGDLRIGSLFSGYGGLAIRSLLGAGVPTPLESVTA